MTIDDQLFYQKKYIEQSYDIALDLECYIFQCSDSEVTMNQGQIYNPITRCFNCVYHGNGGDSEKQQFEVACISNSMEMVRLCYTYRQLNYEDT